MLKGFIAKGILVSKNSKTGLSINVNTCKPTKWCAQHCYRRFRTWDIINKNGWESTPNTGPITWPLQRAAYVRNEARIKELSARGGLEEAAAEIARRLEMQGQNCIRGNGTGDLFPELVELYFHLAVKGIRVYGFTRNAELLRYLYRLCLEVGLLQHWHSFPFFMGSVDKTTSREEIVALWDATKRLSNAIANLDDVYTLRITNHLAYATAASDGLELTSELRRLAYTPEVIFGYHATNKRTVLNHYLECPATAGEDIKCLECRRCIGDAQ